MDQDVMFNDELATTYTNSSGYFDVTVNNQTFEGGVDLFIRLEFDDNIMDIKSHSLFASPYYWDSTVSQDVQTSEINFGTLPLNSLSTNLEGAFSIWYWIKKGNDYYVNNSSHSSQIPKVEVKFEDGVETGAYHSGSTIVIGGNSANMAYFDGDVILHEYGHHIMAHTAGAVPGAGGSHTYTDPSSLATAYSEAWAHFFSCSVRNSDRTIDTDPSGWFGANIETPAYITSGGTNSTTPLVSNYGENAKYELNAGAVIWDLRDTASDGVDTVTHSFSTADNVMAGNNSRHIYDFYDRWFAASGSSYSKETLWNVFESRKCSYDLQVPVVSISYNGTTVSASATDNIAVKKYEWYVDGGYYSQGNGSSSTLNGSSLSFGGHTIEFRAYDPEGLNTFAINSDGSNSRPRVDRYGSSTIGIYVSGSSMQANPVSNKEAILKTNPRKVNEYHDSLSKTIPVNEKILLSKIDLLNTNDTSKYTVNVGKNKDLKIYSHILGIMNSINIYSPDGKLYKTYNYISPDKPIVIKNAAPGEWSIELVYVTQEDIEKYTSSKDISSITSTPVSLIVTTVPSAVDLTLPKIVNNKNIIADLYQENFESGNIKIFLDDNYTKDNSIQLKEGINKISVERVEDGYKSERKDYYITLDTTAPEIELFNKENIATSEKEVLIHGLCSSDVESFTINGSNVQISEFGNGFAQYYAINNGTNIFTLAATDKAGNKMEKVVTVIKK